MHPRSGGRRWYFAEEEPTGYCSFSTFHWCRYEPHTLQSPARRYWLWRRSPCCWERGFPLSKTRNAIPITAASCCPRASAPRWWRASSGQCVSWLSAPNGDLYAALSGKPGDDTGGVLAFRDRDGDGKPDERASFGPGGGNDVKLHNGYLYFALNDRVVRYRLERGKARARREGGDRGLGASPRRWARGQEHRLRP